MRWGYVSAGYSYEVPITKKAVRVMHCQMPSVAYNFLLPEFTQHLVETTDPQNESGI